MSLADEARAKPGAVGDLLAACLPSRLRASDEAHAACRLIAEMVVALTVNNPTKTA